MLMEEGDYNMCLCVPVVQDIRLGASSSLFLLGFGLRQKFQIHDNNSNLFNIIGEGLLMAPTVPVSHILILLGQRQL